VVLASGGDDAARASESVRERRYDIARPQVLDELIDDELVVINFDTGKYHGIRGGGVDIWRLLEAGHSVLETTEWLARHYTGVDAGATRAIEAFVWELEDQRLIVCRAESAHLPQLSEHVDVLEQRRAFVVPELDSRDDLQDYLALDPIHDVDERGWPNARR